MWREVTCGAESERPARSREGRKARRAADASGDGLLRLRATLVALGHLAVPAQSKGRGIPLGRCIPLPQTARRME
jgi:hypothetical protein